MKTKFATAILAVVALACTLGIICAPAMAFADAQLSQNPVLRLEKGQTTGKRVEIIARLEKNSGIMAMSLTLTYDTSVLKLVQARDGTALSTLSPTHSGTLKTYPYVVNYLGRENNYSTGILLTFVFEILDNAADGTYEIALTSPKQQVVYLDAGDRKYKSLISDTVSVTVSGEDTTVTPNPAPTEPETPPNRDWILPVCLGAAGLVIVAVATILILKKGTRKQ